MDIAELVGVWVHALSTVIMFGYYGVLGRIVLPALAKSLHGTELGRATAAIERRAFPFMVLSIVAFTVTGAYLLLVDQEFAGLGNFRESTWNALMLVKHGVVIVMVLGAGLVHVLAGRLAEADLADEDVREGLGWLRLAAEGTTGLGALILLLTAAAQLS